MFSAYVGEHRENRIFQGAVAPRASKTRAPVTNHALQGVVAHRVFDNVLLLF